MAVDAFTVLADPQRRRILEQLRGGDASVGELVAVLQLPQPTVSKHLRVLRQAGFVVCRTSAQKRIYSLASRPFEDLDAWLAPYRHLWENHLDAPGRHLDSNESAP